MKNGSVSILRCFFFTSQSTSQMEVEITINCVTGLFALDRKLASSSLSVPGHSDSKTCLKRPIKNIQNKGLNGK